MIKKYRLKKVTGVYRTYAELHNKYLIRFWEKSIKKPVLLVGINQKEYKAFCPKCFSRVLGNFGDLKCEKRHKIKLNELLIEKGE